MAILKYTDAEGNVHSVNSYKINNVIVTQEKGESTASVMSQKAVTDEIKKVNSLIPTKVSQLTNDENYLTQHQSLADYAKTADVNTSLAKKANSADVYTKGDIDTKVTNINSSITNETNRATTAENKIKTDLTSELNKKVATVTIEKDSTNDLQYHLMVDGEKSGEINIPKDQFLSNVVYSSDTKVITFTFETTTGTTTTDVNISDLIDTYTAGNGLTLTDGKFSVKKDATSQAYIEVTADGVKVIGVDEALALKANTTDVTTSLANKVDNATYATDKSNINTSINTVSDNLTAEVTRATGVEDGIKAEVAKKANTTDVNISLDKKLDKTTYTTDKATYALKSDVATELGKKANTTDVTTELNKKANSADVYTTAQVDEKVNVKANAADVYTRDEIDTITAKMDGGEF